MDRFQTEELLIGVLGVVAIAAILVYLYYEKKMAKPKTQQTEGQAAPIPVSASTTPVTAPSQEEVQALANHVASLNDLSAPVSTPSSTDLASIGAQAARVGLDPETAQNAAIVAAAVGAKYIPFTDAYGRPISESQYVANQQTTTLAANPTQTSTTSAGVTMYRIPGTDTYVTKDAYLAYLQRMNG